MSGKTRAYRFAILDLAILTLAGVSAQYREWSPDDADYPGLVCPDKCYIGNAAMEKDSCCHCNSKATWETGLSPEPVSLSIEYNDITGHVSYLVSQTNISTPNLTGVEHSYGRLRSLPQNMCQFPTLVSMVLDHNKIETVSNITCLVAVEVIDLSFNSIKAITNETFSSLRRLRYLNLANNPVKRVDPYSFQGKDRAIFHVDLSFGKIETLQFSNLFFEPSFCSVILDGNPLQDFTNPDRFTIDTSKLYGKGGHISCVDCKLIQMMNLSDIGIHYEDVLKYIDISIDTSGSNIACDCILAEYFGVIALAAIEKFWVTLTKEYNKNLTCQLPESLRGIPVNTLSEQFHLDEMTCEVPEHCPRTCHCYSQPSRDHLVINCTDAGLRELPGTLPYGHRYTLLFQGNNIHALDKRDYLDRVYNADFSYNPIQTVSETAITALPDDVDLDMTDNKLNSLPIGFSQKDPNKVSLGTLSIDCSCDNVWIAIWQRKNTINISSTVQCANYEGINILDISDETLGCNPTSDSWKHLSISLSSILSFIIGGSLLFIFYRPEIFLLYRHRLLRRKHDFSYPFDVYVCFEEDNNLVTKWVVRDLLPFLQTKGYRVHIPCIDDIPGCIGVDSRKAAIDNSRAYLTILTKDSFISSDDDDLKYDSQYVRSNNSLISFEFSHIWTNFKKNKLKRLLVINFDNTSIKEAKNRYFQAYLRTREVIDFTNRHDKILESLVKKIGPPKPPNANVVTRISVSSAARPYMY